MNLYTRHPMSEPPKESGKYLVGHRGHQVVRHFLAADRTWYEGTKLGWQGALDFAPAPWMGFITPDATGDGLFIRREVIIGINHAEQLKGKFA